MSSRFSTAGVQPMSRPEVLRALQAARAAPAADEVAAPVTTAPPPSPPVDAAPPGPSAGSTSAPAPAPPASTLPRPGATAGTFINAAVPSTTTSVTVAAQPPGTSTTATTQKRPDSKNATTSTTRKPTTTTSVKKDATTTSGPSKDASRSREQSISSRGGVVTVRWSDGRVKFVVAHPKAGYEMKVWDNGPDRVVVSFYKDGHASWVGASYRDGSPASQVVECSASRNHICR